LLRLPFEINQGLRVCLSSQKRLTVFLLSSARVVAKNFTNLQMTGAAQVVAAPAENRPRRLFQ
jgi:hypothetical protein